MFLSHVLIDLGSNPDRPRPGRQWLRNIYHVHQRLSMAFPKPPTKEEDGEFLKPFRAERFACERFLFRVERSSATAGTCSVLVLSQGQPDWNYAFRNAAVMLAAPCQCREYNPSFSVGESLRFRILMNLSQKSAAPIKRAALQCGTTSTTDIRSKRLALTWPEDSKPEDTIVPWFTRKAAMARSASGDVDGAGFELCDCEVCSVGWVLGFRPRDKSPLRFRSALLEGKLRVTDARLFLEAMARGLGSAKAFGFGLLSVAPVG